MGYHDAREIPNYWAYAHHFVLQDHMFEPDTSWSLPAHLFMVSEWSARCRRKGDPMSCVNAIENPLAPPHEPQNPTGRKPDYAWTDLTYLLHRKRVPWAYYVFAGAQPDCDDGAAACRPVKQSAATPGIWNPLPWFTTVRRDHQLRNIKPIAQLLRCRQARGAAGGLVDHSEQPLQRAPAEPRHARPGLRHRRDQRRHAEPRLELDRDLPRVGRLGRLLRPRGAAPGRRERLRAACARAGDLPVRANEGSSTTRR